MATVSRAVVRVKSNVTDFLPRHVIHDAADAVGHRYRDRKLGPVPTVLLLVLQLLSANASLAHARAIGGYGFCVSALAQARTRLPIALLQRVLDWIIRQALPDAAGSRIVLIDAFNCLTPDTRELRRWYRRPRQQRSGSDYPQVRTLGVFDLISGLLLAQHDFAADRHESPQLRCVLGYLRRGDIVVLDRSFVSYANLCLLNERGVHVVARLASGLHARRDSRRTRQHRLGKRDALVRWQKPTRRSSGGPGKIRWKSLPDALQLRELAVTATAGRCRRITLITDLTDPIAYPVSLLARWYRRRWEVETDIRHLKQTMNLEFFRTRTVKNVKREMLLRAIAYNLVRLAMLGSAKLQKLKDPTRVSFADALRWLTLQETPGQESLARLLTHPDRLRTQRPRKVKYRGKNHRILKTQPPPQKRAA
jgi:hypothetical protein